MTRCTNCFTKCGPTSPRTTQRLSIGADFYCEDCYPLCVKIQKRLSVADSRGAGAGIVLSPPKSDRPNRSRTMPRRRTVGSGKPNGVGGVGGKRASLGANTYTPMTVEVTEAADPMAGIGEEDAEVDADAPPKCLRCHATAYIADSIKIDANRVAHKSCMRCIQCNTDVRMTGPDAATVRNGNFFCSKFPACESQVSTSSKDGYHNLTVSKATRNKVGFFEALASTEPPAKSRSQSVVAPVRSARSTSPEKSPASPPLSNGSAAKSHNGGELAAGAKDSLGELKNGDSGRTRSATTSPKYPTVPAQRTRQPSRLAGIFKRKKSVENDPSAEDDTQSFEYARRDAAMSVASFRADDEDSDFDYDRAGVEVLREAVKDLQLQLKASQDSLRVQQQASLNEVAELKMQHRNKVSHFQTLIAERDLRVSQLEADVATQKKKVRHAKKKAEALKKANGVKDGGEEDVVEKEEKATTPSLCTDDDGSCVHQLLMEKQMRNFERDFLTMKVELCNTVDRMNDLEMENNLFREHMPQLAESLSGGGGGGDPELSKSVSKSAKKKSKKEKKDKKKKRKSEKSK